MMTPPATAAEANSIARKKSPLPRKTVAKKRSSIPPRRPRSTPMNHKKAIPANGTRFSARATVLDPVLSQAPASSGSARTESRNNRRTEIMRTEKRMPAMAAARGVLPRALIKLSSGFFKDATWLTGTATPDEALQKVKVLIVVKSISPTTPSHELPANRQSALQCTGDVWTKSLLL